MKQITFNNKFGLTDLVIQGRKTMMRILVPRNVVSKIRKIQDEYYEATFDTLTDKEALEQYYFSEHEKGKLYEIGEILAIANSSNDKDEVTHCIQITNIRIERVQDISDDDVVREGFSLEYVNNERENSTSYFVRKLAYVGHQLRRYKEIASSNPQEAYSILFDKIHKVGAWKSNPWVFVYEFKRVDYGGNKEIL